MFTLLFGSLNEKCNIWWSQNVCAMARILCLFVVFKMFVFLAFSFDTYINVLSTDGAKRWWRLAEKRGARTTRPGRSTHWALLHQRCLAYPMTRSRSRSSPSITSCRRWAMTPISIYTKTPKSLTSGSESLHICNFTYLKLPAFCNIFINWRRSIMFPEFYCSTLTCLRFTSIKTC